MSLSPSPQQSPTPDDRNNRLSDTQAQEGTLSTAGIVPAPLTGAGPIASTTAAPSAGLARWRDVVRLFTLNPKMAFGMALVCFFLLLAIFGPIIIQKDPNAFSNDILEPPSATHWLGTTQTGQDVFTQVVVGSRISILLGFGTGLVVTLISVAFGLTAGYFGGLIDDVLSLLINIFIVLPSFPLAIVVASYLPFKGPINVALVITVTSWAYGARVLRAQTLSMRRREFVEAARSGGETTLRIIFAEILPNEIAIVAAGFVGTTIYVILAEAGLEFLGLGNSAVISWGTMFFWAQNNDALLLGAWWWIVPPGLCIALIGAALAFINFGIDEIANPRLRREAKMPPTRKSKGSTSTAASGVVAKEIA